MCLHKDTREWTDEAPIEEKAGKGICIIVIIIIVTIIVALEGLGLS